MVFRSGFDPSFFYWNFWNWNYTTFLLFAIPLQGHLMPKAVRCPRTLRIVRR